MHAADIQDRDGGVLLLATLFGMFPFLLKLYADGGYQGPEFQQAVAKILRRVNIEIVKRSDQAKGFLVLPKRLAEPLPQAGQGLGKSQPQGACLPAPGINPPDVAKTMQPCMMFPDRL